MSKKDKEKFRYVAATMPLQLLVMYAHVKHARPRCPEHCVLANAIRALPNVLKVKVYWTTMHVIFVDDPHTVVKYKVPAATRRVAELLDGSPESMKQFGKLLTKHGLPVSFDPCPASMAPGYKKGQTGTNKRSGRKPSRLPSYRPLLPGWEVSGDESRHAA